MLRGKIDNDQIFACILNGPAFKSLLGLKGEKLQRLKIKESSEKLIFPQRSA